MDHLQKAVGSPSKEGGEGGGREFTLCRSLLWQSTGPAQMRSRSRREQTKVAVSPSPAPALPITSQTTTLSANSQELIFKAYNQVFICSCHYQTNVFVEWTDDPQWRPNKRTWLMNSGTRGAPYFGATLACWWFQLLLLSWQIVRIFEKIAS